MFQFPNFLKDFPVFSNFLKLKKTYFVISLSDDRVGELDDPPVQRDGVAPRAAIDFKLRSSSK